MHCKECAKPLCREEELVWFKRHNKQNGTEVHLMLKPEGQIPATFARAAEKKGETQESWTCAHCGTGLGDTWAAGIHKSPLTAFKPQSILLARHAFGNKVKWPQIYDWPQFSGIELRGRDTFAGSSAASSSHP